MVFLPSRFGKRENVAALHRRFLNLSPFFTGRGKRELPSRTEFQALEPGRDVKADLALEAERL